MDNTTIKENIRKIRKARKMTQEEMALQLGISITAYRDLEKGSTSILNSNVYRIADLLDTPAEEIVLGYRPSQAEGVSLREMQQSCKKIERWQPKRLTTLRACAILQLIKKLRITSVNDK